MQLLLLNIRCLLLSQHAFHDILGIGPSRLNMLTLARILKMIHISPSSSILMGPDVIFVVDIVSAFELDALLFEHWGAITVEKRQPGFG